MLGLERVNRARASFRRQTARQPMTLPPPPADWSVPFTRMAGKVGIDGDLGRGHELAAKLLDPVLGSSAPSGGWDPTAKRWRRQQEDEEGDGPGETTAGDALRLLRAPRSSRPPSSERTVLGLGSLT